MIRRTGFGFAEERLLAADSLWKHEGLTAVGIECLQEGVERFLKGYLIAKGWRLVTTHDLGKLVSDAQVYEPRFNGFVGLAEELTEEFFAQHYPGEDTTTLADN